MPAALFCATVFKACRNAATGLRFVLLCMFMMCYLAASKNDITFKNKYGFKYLLAGL